MDLWTQFTDLSWLVGSEFFVSNQKKYQQSTKNEEKISYAILLTENHEIVSQQFVNFKRIFIVIFV